MMEGYLLKGLLIGIIFGVPAGAIGALTIQRAFESGFIAGLITGLGSSVAEVLYACVGIFGVTIISEFLSTHQQIIKLLGGTFILVLGILIFLKKKPETSTDTVKKSLFLHFLSSFVVAILNPAIIFSFFVALTAFDIKGPLDFEQGTGLVLGVFVGTLLWWTLLSGVVAYFRNQIKERIYQWLNYILGSFLTVFGLVVIMEGVV